jgi:hypothetical protein
LSKLLKSKRYNFVYSRSYCVYRWLRPTLSAGENLKGGKEKGINRGFLGLRGFIFGHRSCYVASSSQSSKGTEILRVNTYFHENYQKNQDFYQSILDIMTGCDTVFRVRYAFSF